MGQFSAGGPLSSKQEAGRGEVGELGIAPVPSDNNVFEFRSTYWGSHGGGLPFKM